MPIKTRPRRSMSLHLIPCLLLWGLLAACTSCASGNGLKAHSHAAETLDDIAANAKATVLELRAQALGDAVAAAKASGLNDAETERMVREAAADFDAGPAIGAVNAFVAAKDVYVRAVLAVAQKDDPAWDDIKPILRDVLTAYSSMRDALGKPDKMPEVPDAFAKLLGRLEPDKPTDLVIALLAVYDSLEVV